MPRRCQALTKTSAQPAADERIDRAVKYIAQNITEPLPLTGLAMLSGYSLSHFKLRFREVTGMTPALYITLARVEQARRELTDGQLSITDIAYKLGWSSSNYFCAVFKKHTGLSPLQYRKQGGQGAGNRDQGLENRE